ncbi:metal ABC transporter solute-binding protein, Zn/Mn family [Paeniglutamicibacter cryotolerans]|uniref:Zinc/manganese transport system substrate-binding protein n=1 Tax=Paeniglutamicibacter cryotolerans TaxID=670079 RepID=A0A839QDZ4_9MICC|nr:zinc ABC transporter substrate-binding protein [Paeniglutamicibacter cryotolerans]MBB2994369.1 zinc/manganese transport system substrate-binding protein [Paeniglutamicibacter cryotolerans]
MRRSSTLAVLATIATLSLASCASEPASSAGTRLNVVASTTVYADLVRQVGGEDITTTAIITRTSQDPHSYEATPRDKLAVSKADLVIENGGGYDAFMEPLVKSSGKPADRVVSVVDLAPAVELAEAAGRPTDHDGHDHGGFNEHLWYDLPTMRALITKIAETLTEADPGSADLFADNATKLDADLGALEKRLAALRKRAEGRTFAATEPVAAYLLTGAGLRDETPHGFGEAVEGGLDVPPLVLNELKTALEHGDIDLLALNTQTASDQTAAIAGQAKANGVPVLEFTETLPGSLDFQGWMSGNITALEDVPGLGTR